MMIGIVNSAVARTSSKVSVYAAALFQELTYGDIICYYQHGDETGEADYDRYGTEHEYKEKANSLAFET